MHNKPTACIYMDQNNIFFRYKRLDFKRLLEKLKEEFNVIKAISYMALDNKQEMQKKFVTYLANNGWKCFTIDIGTNTNIDCILSSDIVNDFNNMLPDWIILISGDGDYSYTLDLVSKQGARTFILGAKDFVSLELLKATDRVEYIETSFPEVILEVNGGNNEKN